MKSFVPSVAFVVIALRGGTAALPTGDAALARRVGDFFFPMYWPQASASNGPGISVSGANGGVNYGRREEAEEDSDVVFYPWFNIIPQPSSGSMSTSGANSDTAAIQRRDPEDESENFLPPGSFYWPPASMASKPGISASPSRGSISRRAEGLLGPLTGFQFKNAATTINAPTRFNGANGGFNSGVSGAN